MDYINEIKDIADQLDRRGLLKQANLLDKYLYKIAQEAPPAAPAEDPTAAPAEDPLAGGADPLADDPLADMGGDEPEEEDPYQDTKEKMSRTTFLMLSELREFYSRNLSDFMYFGETDIKTLQAAFDQLVTMYRVLLRNVGKQFNKGAVDRYDAHLKKLQKEVDRSKKMKLTPIKVRVDKFLLYNEFEILLKKIERHYDSGLKELQPVLRKARAVRDAFSNMIQRTSEEVAHADLIETSQEIIC